MGTLREMHSVLQEASERLEHLSDKQEFIRAILGPALAEHDKNLKAFSSSFASYMVEPMRRASELLAASLAEQTAGVSHIEALLAAQGADLAAAAQALASLLRPEAVALRLHVTPDDGRAALGRLGEMTTASADLYAEWSQPGIATSTVPEALSTAPVVECFHATDVLIQSAPGESAFGPELAGPEARLGEQFRRDTEDALVPLLETTHPDLVVMVRGARAAFEDRRPDWVRHFITSLRELGTHVLHRLAPDDLLQAWSTSKEDYDKGKPTWRARLKFICRGVASDSFKAFVEKDVTAAVELITLLQGGTHGVSSSYSEAQLLALKVRMEALIRYLIEISRQAD
jgi:hypothetical protein